MHRLLILLALPLMLGAAPVPSGTMTLMGTDPVSISVDLSRRPPHDGFVYIQLYCAETYETYTEEYLGYDSLDEDGLGIFDGTEWFVYYGTEPDGDCRAVLFLRVEPHNAPANEYILDVIYFDVV